MIALFRYLYYFPDFMGNLWQSHRNVIRQYLSRLEKQQVPVHIPVQSGLYQRRSHSQFHTTPEIFFQTGGATDFKCPGGSFRTGTGSICVMPRGVPHHEIPVNLKTPYSVLVCLENHQGIYFICGRSPGNHVISSQSADLLLSPLSIEAFRYLDHISAFARSDSTYREGIINHLLITLLMTFLNELQHPRKEKSPHSQRIQEAIRLIHSHLADPQLSVAGLANALNCSPDHLTRLFQEECGSGPATWIRQQRIIMSQRLLRESAHNISEVAWACGFTTTSYFIRVFKSHTGLTPKQFRDRQPQQD